eukprot:c8567_g1_i1.p1 GENE.c8567_g1_i1~~c8567_g1_i1.p1  ORF type:complete len:361 (-),score=133.28 c8567_g1_i1:130-1212(-)
MAERSTLETEKLIEGGKPAANEAKSPISVAFSLIFCLGFGIALIYAGATNWNDHCDQPLKHFLIGFGATGVLASIVFLVLSLTSSDDDGAQLTGISMVSFWAVIVIFFAIGTTGVIFYWASEDCDTLAAVAHRWTFAGVLAFILTASLMVSSVFGKFGGPFFAVFGFFLGALFQGLADLFKGLAEAVSEDKNPENKPPNRSASGEFSLYVNHAAFLWLFAYILMQVHDEKDYECDTPLPACLIAFSAYGIFMTYCNFLFEKFAGIVTREKLKTYWKYLYGINITAFVIWGVFTADRVFESDTCKDSSKNVYRLAFLLSCVFFVLAGFLFLGLCAGIADFLCSGRLRFVVVVETGDEEEAE